MFNSDKHGINILRYMKNKKLLLSQCDSIIESFSDEEVRCMYCKDELLKRISASIASDKDSVSGYSESCDDYYEIAMGYICSNAFDLAANGWIRNPVTRNSLCIVHYKALKWGYNHGIYTSEEFKEELEALSEAMRFTN